MFVILEQSQGYGEVEILRRRKMATTDCQTFHNQALCTGFRLHVVKGLGAM